jgi:hypothetical protein
MFFQKLIEECRREFGSSPRTVYPWNRPYLFPRPPDWMHDYQSDKLWVHFKERNALIKNGQVHWARMVQANSLLFEPGDGDCPGEAIVSPHPWYDANPLDLENIAKSLYSVKETTPADPEMRAFADHLTDERTRMLRHPVPRSLTAGRPVTLTSIMFHRKHLPDGYLQNGLFPLVVAPDTTNAAMILPVRYWPQELISYWRNAG